MMAAIAYYLSLPLIYLISLLPWRVMYALSHVMYLVIYRLLSYRVKVVRENLTNALPERDTRELRQIEDRFYRYFCDLILETIKTLTISPRDIEKHIKIVDMSAFDPYFEKGQSVVIAMGHWGNWELAGSKFSQMDGHQLYVIYHPMANPYFDRLLYHMRTRLGNKLYAMKETFRRMVADRKELTATAFIADQTPSNPDGAYWTSFMHQDTPVFTGMAKISKALQYPVIYISMNRLKQGLYELSAEVLVDDPANSEENDITEAYIRRLELDIRKCPEIWLWTHRRWKHKRPNN